ncbi:MAG: NTP transferase domain-containing protein [Spirochaetia bacterium]|nr:NTP transferase domain-containing protein [Spirochaetia bacterium]
MIGIVLCGGLSHRMGKDKGLIIDKTNNKAWGQIAENKLKKLNIPVFISINMDQKEQYSKYFSQEELLVDSTNLSHIKGPIKGILTLHQQYPQEDIFVLACDMPKLTLPTLSALYKEYNSLKHSFNYFCFQSETHLETLCAIYTSKGLKKISTKNLKEFSLKNIFKGDTVKKYLISGNIKSEFTNYNSLPAEKN